MASIKDFDCCPHCGAEEYYVKMRVIGSIAENYFRFDGKEADNDHIHDGLRYRFYKKAYCAECGKYIGKVED